MHLPRRHNHWIMVCTRRNLPLELAATEIKTEVERRSYNMPMTNEPTTGEIVRALRDCFERNVNGTCMKCEFAGTKGKYAIDADECGYGCETNLAKHAIDRLESQAKQIAELTAAIKMQSDLCRECAALTVIEQKAEIDALTARAESAERERDELVDLIPHTCNTCYFQSKNLLNEEPCVSCRIYSKWTWRGLPQEGEGKR